MEPNNTITISSLDELIDEVETTTYSTTKISGGGYTLSPGYGAVPPGANITISSPSVYSNISSPYTFSGTGAYPNVSIGAGTGIASPWATYTGSSKIRLDGEGADIEVNGWSLIDAIQKIEERLNILHPNTKLEEEWEELRVLGNKYRELEQHIKDKQATWDRLKAMPPPVID
jgi:hypothetical protein